MKSVRENLFKLRFNVPVNNVSNFQSCRDLANASWVFSNPGAQGHNMVAPVGNQRTLDSESKALPPQHHPPLSKGDNCFWFNYFGISRDQYFIHRMNAA